MKRATVRKRSQRLKGLAGETVKGLRDRWREEHDAYVARCANELEAVALPLAVELDEARKKLAALGPLSELLESAARDRHYETCGNEFLFDDCPVLTCATVRRALTSGEPGEQR